MTTKSAAEYLEAAHSKFDKAKKDLQDNALDCYNKTKTAMQQYLNDVGHFFQGENPRDGGPCSFAAPGYVTDKTAGEWYDAGKGKIDGASTKEAFNYRTKKPAPGVAHYGVGKKIHSDWMEGMNSSWLRGPQPLGHPGPWRNGTCGRDYYMGACIVSSFATVQTKLGSFFSDWNANGLTTDDIHKWESAEFPSDVYEKFQDLFHGTRNPLEGPANGSLGEFVAVDTTTINGPPSYEDFQNSDTTDKGLNFNSPYHLVANWGLGAAGGTANIFNLGGEDQAPGGSSKSGTIYYGLTYELAKDENIMKYSGQSGRMWVKAWPIKGSSYKSTLVISWNKWCKTYQDEFYSSAYETSFKTDQLHKKDQATQDAATKYGAYERVLQGGTNFYEKLNSGYPSIQYRSLALPARRKADDKVGNLGIVSWCPTASEIKQTSLVMGNPLVAPQDSNGRYTRYSTDYIKYTIFKPFYWGPWRCPDSFNYWFAKGTTNIGLSSYAPKGERGVPGTKTMKYAWRFRAVSALDVEVPEQFDTYDTEVYQSDKKGKLNALYRVYDYDAWAVLKDAYNYMRELTEELCEAVSCFFRLDVALRKAEKELVEANEDIVSGAVPDDVEAPTADDISAAKAWLDYHESLEGDIGRLGSGYHKKMMFKEQCYLLSNIFTIANYKKNILDKAQVLLDADFDEGVESGSKEEFAIFAAISSAKAIQRKQSDPPYSVMIDGDSYGFINKLTQNPNQLSLFNMRNHDISTLQPQIRLYKIGYDDDDKTQEIEFKFDSHHNQSKELQFALKNRNKRGSGTGIKNFNFTYDGSNPFSAKKSIKARLTIFANTFDELLECKGKCDEDSKPFDGYKYVDLALKTSNTQKISASDCKGTNVRRKLNDELSKLNFRLKAVVGWAFPKGNTSHMTDGVKDAIYDSFVTLNLTPTTHDFSFDEMGRVTFTINYLAYVEDFFDQKNFNIFMSTTDSQTIVYNQIKRNLEYEYWSDKCEPDQLNKIKKSYAEQIHEEKRQIVSQLVLSLQMESKIYYINMPYEGLRDWMSKGPFSSTEKSAAVLHEDASDMALRTTIGKALKRWDGHSKARSVAMSLSVIDPNNATIPFFYLCDLVDLVIEGIQNSLKELSRKNYTGGSVNSCMAELKKKELKKSLYQFQRYRIVLGPLEIVNQQNSLESTHVNFGDLPISVKYFVEWLTDRLAKKQESVYPLGKFMNDLMQGLVRNFLNNDGCFNYPIRQKTSLQQAAVTAYRYTELETISHEYAYIDASQHKSGGAKRVKYYGGSTSRATAGVLAGVHAADGTIAKGSKGWPLLNVSGKRGENDGGHGGVQNEDNYLIFYAGRTQPLEKMTGDTATDAQAGIMHYVLGKDRGIIKNISLTKTDTKGLAEVRFEQEGFDGLKQLRVVYDVNIDTYPNVQAFPGTYIFVDPRGFAPSTNLKPGDPLNLTQYGLGGYYMIIRSEHTFGSGMANTRIFAKWVNHLAHEPDEDTTSDDYKPSKCTTLRAYKNID